MSYLLEMLISRALEEELDVTDKQFIAFIDGKRYQGEIDKHIGMEYIQIDDADEEEWWKSFTDYLKESKP